MEKRIDTTRLFEINLADKHDERLLFYQRRKRLRGNSLFKRKRNSTMFSNDWNGTDEKEMIGHERRMVTDVQNKRTLPFLVNDDRPSSLREAFELTEVDQNDSIV